MSRIVIDFDGTLVHLSQTGELIPVPGARAALEGLRAAGHTIVIYSCRTTEARLRGVLLEEIAAIEDALTELAIPFDEIFSGDKPVADAYVDDRAVPFSGNWSETAKALAARLRPVRSRS